MKDKILGLFMQLLGKLQGNPVAIQEPDTTPKSIPERSVDKAIEVTQKTLAIEESVLKRHNKQLLEGQVLSRTNPYPTDSVLKRHYDTQAASIIMGSQAVAKAQTDLNKTINSTNCIKPAEPQDSILKRHFVQHSESLRLQKVNPYPSDSVLKRHYDNLAWNRAC